MIYSLNRIDTQSNVGTLPAKQYKVPVGKYKSLHFYFNLTATSGQTIAAGDLGTLELIYNSKSYGTMRVATLQTLANIVSGVEDASSVTGGAATFSCAWWFHLPKDSENALYVNRDNQCFVKYTPASSLAAKLDTSTAQELTLYGEMSDGVTKYIPKWEEDDFILGSGNPVVEGLLNKENIYYLFVENNTNISRITARVDGNFVVDADRRALIQYTHRVFELESFSATLNPILLLHATDSKLDSSLVDNVQVVPSLSTSDTITFITVSLEFPRDLFNTTVAERSNVVSEAIARKEAQGKPAVLLEQISKGDR